MNTDELVVLTPREIQCLLSIDDCINAIEQAFRLHGEHKAAPPQVLSVHADDGAFHVKPGILNLGRTYFAAKVNGNFPRNGSRSGLPTIQGVVILCDSSNGTPLAVMDSRDITALRTAAATAVAAKYLARKDSQSLTICGCGQQGRVHLKALIHIFRFSKIFAYDKQEEQAERFSRQLSTELGLIVTPVADLISAVQQSDIVATCTTSCQPILSAEDIRPGTFIAAVGADNPQKQELHPSVIARSKVVCDILEQCAAMGDLHHALEAGVVTKSRIYAELGEVVARLKPGRESETETIVFDSTGMALQDVAAAAVLYEKAERNGSGVRINTAA